MMVGLGVVDSLASKLTVSPRFISVWSADIFALGTLLPRPVQPDRETITSDATIRNVGYLVLRIMMLMQRFTIYGCWIGELTSVDCDSSWTSPSRVIHASAV